MAEFQEVMKQFKRMCKDNDCRRCEMPICYPECKNYLYKYPQQAEEIIMKWAEEHPIQTNADKFKKVFGFEPSDRCINKKDCFETFCTNCEHKDFWKQEYKEPKGDF